MLVISYYFLQILAENAKNSKKFLNFWKFTKKFHFATFFDEIFLKSPASGGLPHTSTPTRRLPDKPVVWSTLSPSDPGPSQRIVISCSRNKTESSVWSPIIMYKKSNSIYYEQRCSKGKIIKFPLNFNENVNADVIYNWKIPNFLIKFYLIFFVHIFLVQTV